MAVDVTAVRDRATGLFKGFSTSQLVIIGLLGAVALVGGFSFLKWVTAPTYSVLLAGLEAEDAAAVTEKLQADGVPYQLQGGGSTVLVPRELLDEQRLSVAAAGLPTGKTESSWAAFDNQGMTSSSFQQQVAYQRALEGTLASTLTGIEGVRSATVHLSLPEKRVFTEDQQTPRASVLLQTATDLDEGAVDAVTRLVASSVPGLAPGDVSVSDGTGRLLTAEGGARSSDKAQLELEDTLTTRASTMLETLLGPGRAVVRVSAELDTATTRTDSEVWDNTRTAVTSETATEENYEGTNPAVGGVVAEAPEGEQTTGTYDKSSSSREIAVSRTVTSAQQAAGGVKRLTVAVAVDAGAVNAPSAREIEALVGNAVGLDPARGDTIAVSLPTFLPVEEPAADETAGGGVVGSATSQAPAILGGLLLLLVTLGLFRTVRRGTTTEVSAEQLEAALASAGGAHALPAGAQQLALEPVAVPAPRDGQADVVHLVDENPDEVAALLRGWLASTGSER